MKPDKPQIVATLRASLVDELATLERVGATAAEEAVTEEAKSENEYDTRATEASYLARGLANRIAELRQVVAWFSSFDATKPLDEPKVQVGALVELDGGEWLFFSPAGGGTVQVAGKKIKLVSRSSPLGAALVGLEAGDAAEFDTPRGILEREIVGVW